MQFIIMRISVRYSFIDWRSILQKGILLIHYHQPVIYTTLCQVTSLIDAEKISNWTCLNHHNHQAWCPKCFIFIGYCVIKNKNQNTNVSQHRLTLFEDLNRVVYLLITNKKMTSKSRGMSILCNHYTFGNPRWLFIRFANSRLQVEILVIFTFIL